MKVSIFKNLFKSTDVPYIVELEKVVERIREGKSKGLILQIRSATTKEERDRLKRNLPSILFAGEFTERNSDSCKQHSGLMVLDFDKFPTKVELRETAKQLKKNPFVMLVFVSPSGFGLKAVIRVSNKLDKVTHPKVFKAFSKTLDSPYFDMSNSNIDRVCFESWDKDIFYNKQAKIYNPELIEEGFSVSEKPPLIPVTNEDHIIDFIMKWDWKKDFKEGERNNYIFDLSGAFCEYGVSQATAEGFILNNVIIGDFEERECLNTIKSAYRRRTFNSKYFEDYSRIKRIKNDLKIGKKEVIKKHSISEEIYEEIKESVEHEDFWYIDDKEKVKINPFKYKQFLERNGFRKYYHNNSQKSTLVKVTSNIVSETSSDKIKDFVLNYLVERQELGIWNYCASFQNLFSESYLNMLDTIELRILRDERNKSYFAFKNGVLEVTKNESKLIDYIEIEYYIWESQIIPFDFKVVEENENDYKRFISNVSGGEPLPFETTIGYLLSTYKNKMNNRAVILNDEVISENPEGGTGKGLFTQGLERVRKVSILDGKTFDDKKSFPYQTVSTETQILFFDDVKKNWDFESKFSLVTEGITLERKNKDAIKLTVEESPKLLVSTNYAIKGAGNSHDRRRHEIEFAQHYGKKYTPKDEFGRQLFDEWTEDEWMAFFNYMVYCVQAYLKNDLVQQNAKNIKLRKFIAETSMEFYEWIEDENNFPRNERNEKQVYFDKFTYEYQDFKKWLTRKRFAIWVQKYASFVDFKYNDGISNGQRWYEIITPDAPEKPKEDDVPF